MDRERLKIIAAVIMYVLASGCADRLQAPVAVIAAPEEVNTGSTVQLDGRKSRDPQGLPLVFEWNISGLPPGSKSALNDPNVVNPSFVPDVAGLYVFKLTVSNSSISSAPAYAEVEAVSCGSSAPVLDEISFLPTKPNLASPVRIEAMAHDPDNEAGCDAGEALSFEWRFEAKPMGSRASLNDSTVAEVDFMPDGSGTYRLRVAVSDDKGHKTTGTISVDVSQCGGFSPEIVSMFAEPEAPVTGDVVQLRMEYDDEDNKGECDLYQNHSYWWYMDAVPPGSRAVLSSNTSLTPYFKADLPGTYRVAVTITDNTNRASPTRIIYVEVSECGSAAPSIGGISFDPQAPRFLDDVMAAASVRDADNEEPCLMDQQIFHLWSFVSLPHGSGARFNDPSTSTPSFIVDRPGRYAVMLRTWDSMDNSSYSTASLDVPDCGANPPVVESMGFFPLDPVAGQYVTLAAAVADQDLSECGEEQTFSYSWVMLNLPPRSRADLNGASTAIPSFLADVEGEYAAAVTVTDSTGLESEQTVVPVDVSSCGAALPAVEEVSFDPALPVAGSLVKTSAPVRDRDNLPPCRMGQRFSYDWTIGSKPEGSNAVLDDPSSPSPSFTTDVEGEYRLVLSVEDSTGRSGLPFSASIEAEACGASAPEVRAIFASPEEPVAAVPVILSADVFDRDDQPACGAGETFNFQWAIEEAPRGSSAALDDPTLETPAFTPNLDGTYRISLVVTDAGGMQSAQASLDVRIFACGEAPPRIWSVASVPQAPVTGQIVLLLADASDADGRQDCGREQTLSFAWELLDKPGISAAKLDDPAAARPGFFADVEGVYLFRLVVADDTGLASEPGEIAVEVVSCGGNRPVTAPAASDATPNTYENVSFASNASDADNEARCGMNQTLGYSWTLVSLPGGSRAALGGASAENAWLAPDAAGFYTVSLLVTDSTGRTSDPKYVTIEAQQCGNNKPVAMAGLEQPYPVAPSRNPQTFTVATNTTVMLDGSGSYDDDNACGMPQVLTYQWSFLDVPPGFISSYFYNTAGEDSWFTPSVPGTYKVRLRVSDGRTWSDPVAVAVNANSSFTLVDGDGGQATSIAINPQNGAPAIAYYEEGAKDLRFAKCQADCDTASPSWSQEIVESTNDVGQPVSLAFTSTGRPVLVYFNATACSTRYAAHDGASWKISTIETPANCAAGRIGEHVSIMINGDGNPAIAYTNQTLGAGGKTGLRYAACTGSCLTSGPAWPISSIDTPMVAGYVTGIYNSIAKRPSGNPVVSYYDSTAGDLKYAECVSGCTGATPTWQKATVDAGGLSDVGQYTSIKVGPDGLPRIAYYDKSGQSLRLARCTAANCWSTAWQVNVADGLAGANVGQFASLGLTSLGQPIVSYYDATNTALKLAVYEAAAGWNLYTVDNSAEVGLATSLVLAADNDVRISYYDKTATAVRHLRIAR